MNDPKISIIVPVYKVEPYLRKCLDSIVKQTYWNLQVVLVDDGSPDHCGEICDEYADKDNRIMVIHQTNQGLSAARNSALAVVSGEYLGFVDSDDWIEPDMFEYLLRGILKRDADIAVCGRCEESGRNSFCRSCSEEIVLSNEDAMEQLLKNDGYMQNAVWDKLYRRELFDNIVFPVGQTYEDMAIMHRLFARASKVVCLPEEKYHYLVCTNSISGDITLRNRVNHYVSAKCRYDEMRIEYPQFENLLATQCIASAISIWSVYYINPAEERKKYFAKIAQISAFAREHSVTKTNLGLTGQIVMRLIPYPTWWAFGGARVCGFIYQLKHGRRL